ncbi:hypothetical protein MIMGU_mgv1a006677mg [Erythranthe guttata]|uniref:EamA domain-containing protein n=1 Tax=Erythranthe guttata TaxID=4155 RepID=A0A022R444_ERYGU|nr:PREDICTED: WAT1-related protein At1g68170-like [Erythranthe guttata]EYU35417.1 hypothetical protein MIMGU_mgv1a006677mg [Erythranthe guttata]|eukprot:XP_012839783.1 PREDICTED: WAT1-related protein At1g68170-like [Erythranthe guttata]
MVSYAKISKTLDGMKPTIMMIVFQAVFAVVNIGYKLAANDGMRLPILVAYRFLFSAAFIIPVAFFVERKKRPKLTWKVASYGFLCGLFGGALGQNLYLKALDLTSATFVSAMTNLIPAMTFIVAVCLRLERLGWNTAAGKAKVLGTLLGISGAMLLTFYKGPEINLWDTHINLLELTKSNRSNGSTQVHHGGQNLVLGSILALVSCVCYSLWLIVQAKAAAKYPCPYSITAMMSFWASIQGVGFALCMEREWNDWIPRLNIGLLTAAVAGILGSGVMFVFVAWCVRMRGPLFVSVFNPLLLVMVAIAGSLFLEEKLHWGMVLGGILIVAGLYIVLWGKGRELKQVSQQTPQAENEEQTPQAENEEQTQTQVHIEMPTVQTQSAPRLSGGSSHGRGSSRRTTTAAATATADDEREDDSRGSHSSSDYVGGLYLYHS